MITFLLLSDTWSILSLNHINFLNLSCFKVWAIWERIESKGTSRREREREDRNDIVWLYPWPIFASKIGAGSDWQIYIPELLLTEAARLGDANIFCFWYVEGATLTDQGLYSGLFNMEQDSVRIVQWHVVNGHSVIPALSDYRTWCETYKNEP